MKLASNYPTRQQAVVDGGGLFVVVAASKRGAASAERASGLARRPKRSSRGEEFKRTPIQEAHAEWPRRIPARVEEAGHPVIPTRAIIKAELAEVPDLSTQRPLELIP